MEYFLLQLTTIALEEQYEDYKDKVEHRKTFISIFVGTFILYFYLTLSLSKFLGNSDKDDEINEILSKNKDKDEDEEKFDDNLDNLNINDEKDDNNMKNKEDDEKIKDKEDIKKKKFKYKDSISKLSNEILDGTHAIFFFNGIFSLIVSAFYFSKINIKNYIFEKNVNIIFLPILMNKFYYFTMNYYCLYTSEDNKKFDFISSSTIISIYMGVWEVILMCLKFIIKYLSDEKYMKILFILQMVISGIISLIIGFIFLSGFCYFSKLFYLFSCCNEDCNEGFKLFNYLFCILSFIICFGGCWNNMDTIDEGCNCDNICENCCDCMCFNCECCCFCDMDSCCYSESCDNCWLWIRYDCCDC